MSFLAEAFFNECASKIINDGADYTRARIKSIIDDRSNRNFSTKIYRVIEQALNMVTDKKFKDTDKLYDAIEKIFIGFRDNSDAAESAKCGLGLLCSDVSEYICESFLDKFYAGICRDNDLYKEAAMIFQQKGIEISWEGFQEINEKLDKNHVELIEKINNINANLNGDSNEGNILAEKSDIQNNKKWYYIKNWNDRLFLHLDNDERPLTLADTFIMPDYKIIKYIGRMGFYEADILDQIIDKFIKYARTSNMLITGVPGIGKSSITSWLANRYKDDDNVIILRFRDWEYEELESGLLKAIYHTLACNRRDLENKILVLDGFDEIKALDIRDNLLDAFIRKMKDFDNFKCIITSRPAYINPWHFDNVFELREFDIEQVGDFYKIITGTDLKKIKDLKKNLEVMGIPVILYMAIMSEVDISKNPTKPELYNQIFAEEGGIFDRFSYEGIGYSSGEQIFRDSENTKEYLRFLREVAFGMFEKGSISLKKGEYEIPVLEFEKSSVCILEFPIKHLFENINADIEFIHKSIYEYFVAEYIYSSMIAVLHADGIKVSELAGVLGDSLKSCRLSDEILEFLKFRIRNGNLRDKSDLVNEAFKLMLKDGMTYYTNKSYKNAIHREMNVFANMLETLHLWENISLEFDHLINDYLKYNKTYGLNFKEVRFNGSIKGAILERTELKGANLERAKLIGVNAKKVNLNKAYLRGADLEFADLSGADLKKADLQKAYFRGTILRKADLAEANLEEADLRATNLEETNLKGTNLRGTIFDINQIQYLGNKYDLRNSKVYTGNMGEFLCYEDIAKFRKDIR